MISLRTVDLILKKKQGLSLTKKEIEFLIQGYVNGSIPDYQMSAMLMAICFQGMNVEEQVAFTMETLASGEAVDLSSIDGICVDKHSTGGVGDKTTLVLGPMLAACGLKIAKMSGRGLGHTGGTLDKLESIPGFQVEATSQAFLQQVRDISLAVIGQTANITPADKKLYALRDVTGTVESIGLIAASVMSKKLASGASHILLDVKVGDGAFMKTIEDAKELARAMVDIGNSVGKKTVAVLTDMDEPLGNMIGNSLEVIEAIETLKGKGPEVFTTLCIDLASHLLVMTKLVDNMDQGRQMIQEKLYNGEALEKLRKMIAYQKGDVRVIDDYSIFPQAKTIIEVKANTSQYIKRIAALEVGVSAMLLGAGRESKDDSIDMAVGIELCKKVGDFVNQGDVIAKIYSNGKNEEEAKDRLLNAFEWQDEVVKVYPPILDVVA